MPTKTTERLSPEPYAEEYRKLEETLEEVARRLEALGPRYYGDDYTEQVLDAMREEQRHRLRRMKASPYFGRLDFQEKGEATKSKVYYIGKHGLDRQQTEEPWVLDWRAPAASMFYSFHGGEEPVSYTAPDGAIEGVISLKRSFAIREGAIERVVDNYRQGQDNLSVKDEFLLYRLGEGKDNRLRDIVSTIQTEQDRIIRAPRSLALIIQGVAGSGKTTVALHRLAYLLYQYPDRIRAERMVIFAPNAMFLDYISNVLPELGVEGIQQTTFPDWAMEKLSGSIRLQPAKRQWKQWFGLKSGSGGAGKRTAGQIKGSLRFKRWLDRCLSCFEEHESRQFADLQLGEGLTLAGKTVSDWYKADYKHDPPGRRRERVQARIRRWLEMELSRLPHEMRGPLRKQYRPRLAAYLKKWPETTAVSLYKACFGVPKPALFLPEKLRNAWSEGFKAWMAKRLERDVYDEEDLPALVYLQIKLYGMTGPRFDHTVIDEAQDCSPFQVALLQAFMPEPSFTILGDLGQAIHAYKGIESWEAFMDVFPGEAQSYHELTQSYRSTTEIIEFANRVLSHARLSIPPAEPVFRSGDPVAVERLTQAEELPGYAQRFIAGQESRSSSIAILRRTPEACRELYEELAVRGVSCSLLEEDQREYRGGVSILPVYLAKGLEFDAVLVTDADRLHYPGDPLHAKLLYVGCTRALHRLALVYAGDPSPLLEAVQ